MGKGSSDKTIRYLSGNMYYKGEKVEFVTGNTMTDEEPKTASEVLDELEALRTEEQERISSAFSTFREEMYKTIGLDRIVKYLNCKLGGKE